MPVTKRKCVLFHHVQFSRMLTLHLAQAWVSSKSDQLGIHNFISVGQQSIAWCSPKEWFLQNHLKHTHIIQSLAANSLSSYLIHSVCCVDLALICLLEHYIVGYQVKYFTEAKINTISFIKQNCNLVIKKMQLVLGDLFLISPRWWD